MGGAYRLSADEQKQVQKQRLNASRMHRLLQVREQAKRFDLERLREYRARCDKSRKAVASAKREEWQKEQETEIEKLERALEGGRRNFSAGHDHAKEVDLADKENKIEAEIRKEILDRRALRRFGKAVEIVRAHHAAKAEKLNEIARLRKEGLELDREKARQFGNERQIVEKDREEQEKAISAEDVDRKRKHQFSLVDFRFTRLHQLGVPIVAERHADGKCKQGKNGASQKAQEEAKRFWEYKRTKVANAIENSNRAHDRGEVALLRERALQEQRCLQMVLEQMEKEKRQQKVQLIAKGDLSGAPLLQKWKSEKHQRELENAFEDTFVKGARASNWTCVESRGGVNNEILDAEGLYWSQGKGRINPPAVSASVDSSLHAIHNLDHLPLHNLESDGTSLSRSEGNGRELGTGLRATISKSIKSNGVGIRLSALFSSDTSGAVVSQDEAPAPRPPPSVSPHSFEPLSRTSPVSKGQKPRTAVSVASSSDTELSKLNPCTGFERGSPLSSWIDEVVAPYLDLGSPTPTGAVPDTPGTSIVSVEECPGNPPGTTVSTGSVCTSVPSKEMSKAMSEKRSEEYSSKISQTEEYSQEYSGEYSREISEENNWKKIVEDIVENSQTEEYSGEASDQSCRGVKEMGVSMTVGGSPADLGKSTVTSVGTGSQGIISEHSAVEVPGESVESGMDEIDRLSEALSQDTDLFIDHYLQRLAEDNSKNECQPKTPDNGPPQSENSNAYPFRTMQSSTGALSSLLSDMDFSSILGENSHIEEGDDSIASSEDINQLLEGLKRFSEGSRSPVSAISDITEENKEMQNHNTAAPPGTFAGPTPLLGPSNIVHASHGQWQRLPSRPSSTVTGITSLLEPIEEEGNDRMSRSTSSYVRSAFGDVHEGGPATSNGMKSSREESGSVYSGLSDVPDDSEIESSCQSVKGLLELLNAGKDLEECCLEDSKANRVNPNVSARTSPTSPHSSTAEDVSTRMSTLSLSDYTRSEPPTATAQQSAHNGVPSHTVTPERPTTAEVESSASDVTGPATVISANPSACDTSDSMELASLLAALQAGQTDWNAQDHGSDSEF